MLNQLWLQYSTMSPMYDNKIKGRLEVEVSGPFESVCAYVSNSIELRVDVTQ